MTTVRLAPVVITAVTSALTCVDPICASETLPHEEIVAEFPFPPFPGGGHLVAGFTSSDAFLPAQTFTALRGGQLGTISAAFTRNGVFPPDYVVVELREAPAGRPSAEVLATVLIEGSPLENVEPRHPLMPLMLGAEFASEGIQLFEGQTYAFSLSIAKTGAANACGLIGTWRDDPRGYPGGWMWESQDGGVTWRQHLEVDLSFRVTVLLDSDGDGVPDVSDQCPDTPTGSVVNSEGCSIDQLLACEGPPTGGAWRSHGEFVSTATRVADSFLEEGLISDGQRNEIVNAAAQSDCGKR